MSPELQIVFVLVYWISEDTMTDGLRSHKCFILLSVKRMSAASRTAQYLWHYSNVVFNSLNGYCILIYAR